MVRLKDIAEACGVSVATVSRALNGLTNEGRERTAFICQTAKDMGYYPNAAARTLKTSKSNNIGIIYEDMMTHVYFSSLFDALRREAERFGYDLTFLGRGDFTAIDIDVAGVRFITAADTRAQNASLRGHGAPVDPDISFFIGTAVSFDGIPFLSV